MKVLYTALWAFHITHEFQKSMLKIIMAITQYHFYFHMHKALTQPKKLSVYITKDMEKLTNSKGPKKY